MIKYLVNKLPEKLKFAPHNIIAHPISEILHLLGLEALSIYLHDETIPSGEDPAVD
jgi:hypothetical protein